MKVIMVGTDRKLFEEGSAVRARIDDYGTLVDELHIIVFTKRSLGLAPIKLALNVWLYPTNSFSKFTYAYDGINLAKQIIKSQNLTPEDTIVSCQDPFETGLVGVRLKDEMKFKLQLQVHTDFLSPYYAKSFLNRFRLRLAKAYLPKADSVRVVSERIKRSIVAAYKIPVEKISVLPIFVDPKQFSRIPAFTLQDKYSQFNFVIAMASRLEPEKHITLAIDALAQLHKQYPKIGLVIVGEGSEKKKLEAHARSKQVSHAVVFELWQKDLLPYYATANAFLLTSDYEGYGMTLIEAALSGAAIITTDVGVAGDILVHDKNALIVPVGDQKALVENLARLVQNNGLRMELGRTLRDDIEKHIVTTKQQYLENYKKGFIDTLNSK